MNSDNRFNRRQQLALGTVIMLSPALRLFPYVLFRTVQVFF